MCRAFIFSVADHLADRACLPALLLATLAGLVLTTLLTTLVLLAALLLLVLIILAWIAHRLFPSSLTSIVEINRWRSPSFLVSFDIHQAQRAARLSELRSVVRWDDRNHFTVAGSIRAWAMQRPRDPYIQRVLDR